MSHAGPRPVLRTDWHGAHTDATRSFTLGSGSVGVSSIDFPKKTIVKRAGSSFFFKMRITS